MADGKIVIEIVGLEKGETKSKSDEEKAQDEYRKILTKLRNPVRTFEKTTLSHIQSPIAKQAMTQLYETAKNAVVRVVDYGHTRYFNLSEDYLAENQYNMIKTAYTKSSGAVSSVWNGAISGAMAGAPVAGVGAVGGALIGAAIGAVSWGINETISQNQRFSNYYQQLNAINFNTQFNAKRAGLYDGGRGAGY